MAEIARIEHKLMAATPKMSREELEERADAALQPQRKKGRAKAKKDADIK